MAYLAEPGAYAHDMSDSLDELAERLRLFAEARDWGQFHTPKNLAMALVGEAGELAAELQWLTEMEIDRDLRASALRSRVAAELADILIYLVRLANVCEIDLIAATKEKIDLNEERYPVDLAHGSSTKYNQFSMGASQQPE